MPSQSAASLTASLLVPKGKASALGFAPGAAPAAVTPPHIVKHSAGPPRRSAKGGSFNGTGGSAPAKFSLRLDPERHLRLKLLSAHAGKSRQGILIEALDRYLETQSPASTGGEVCVCLAASRNLRRTS